MFIKIVALITYAAMVYVNFLANSLPINNRSTGDVSNAYPNLFAPAGLTFSIWGLIYLLLGRYVLYQFVEKDEKTEALLKRINPFFIATSLANISWIFTWHYDFIGLSVIIMLALLFFLIQIAGILAKEQLMSWKKWFISAPFSIYFGWITVATIANITVFLVRSGWNGFGIPDAIWTIIILLVGAIIGILRVNKDKSIAYGLVLVWAYMGILLKHVSSNGFNGHYPGIIGTLIVCLVVYGYFVGSLFFKNNN